jgi:hypothetical protein
MEIYNNILCITYSELLEFMSDRYIKKLISNNKITRIRRGCKGFQALISFDSLPDAYKAQYISKYGDPTIEEMNEPLKLLIDEKARAFYSTHTYEKGGEIVHLSGEYIKEYTINATIIGMIIKLLRSREAQTKKLNNCRRDIWETLPGEYERWRAEYGHTLPKSMLRLKDKVRAFKKEGYSALLSGKLGNSSTMKISEKGGKYIIALKRSAVPVYTDEQIFKEFNKNAAHYGFKPVKSLATIHQFLNRPDIKPLWYSAVHGELDAHLLFDRKNRTILPTMRDSLWYGDGTKLNLYYRGQSSTGATIMKTTSVYEVIDAYSEVLLGYHISDTENYVQQYNAFRMATTASKHRPFEIVTDNQGGQKSDKVNDLFKKIGRMSRPTAPYNPQSKTIENIFGRFQSQVLHQNWAFTGQNITARGKDSRPNIERIQANVDKLPTFQELKSIYAEARKEWNEMEHPKSGIRRIDMYNQSVNTDSPEITPLEMVEIFWIQTERPSLFDDQGITIQVAGKKYQYEVYSSPGVPDFKWRSLHTREKFFVKYDPADMSSIRLYSIDRAGGLRFERIAEPYMVTARNIQEQSSEDRAFLRMVENLNKEARIERQVKGRAISREFGMDLDQQGLRDAPLKGLNKEQQAEIERRLRNLDRSDLPLTIGQYTKDLSNITIDEITDIKQHEDKFDKRKAASKL